MGKNQEQEGDRLAATLWISTEMCRDGAPHEVGYIKNCEAFKPDHPEFLHCISCGTFRCVKCGQMMSEY